MDERYSKIFFEAEGKRREEFLVKQKSFQRIECSCGKPDCLIPGLLSVPAHIAAAIRAIVAVGFADRLPNVTYSNDPWPGVTYALSMAGGIGKVEADPSFASDSDSFMCGTAWDREEADRDIASHYTASLIVFNFTWMAYEAAIEESFGNREGRGKPAVAVTVREALEKSSEAASGIRGFQKIYRIARYYCMDSPGLASEISASEKAFPLNPYSASAELIRIFRNYITHGKEKYLGEDYTPCVRFYAMTRLVLILIQYLAIRVLEDNEEKLPLCVVDDDVGEEMARVYLENLHYHDEIWRSCIKEAASDREGGPTARSFSMD